VKPDDEEARVEPTRTSRRTRETRRKLVDAGVVLLRRADYAAVPVAEITQLADVGLGTFYNHFAGKDELFDEAVQSVLNEQTERMSALGHADDSPVTTAAIAMHVVLGLAQNDPAVAVVVARNGLRLLDAEAALVPQARALVEAGQAAGSFAELDVDPGRRQPPRRAAHLVVEPRARHPRVDGRAGRPRARRPRVRPRGRAPRLLVRSRPGDRARRGLTHRAEPGRAEPSRAAPHRTAPGARRSAKMVR
jgi:AcrR family transcriptional regulator